MRAFVKLYCLLSGMLVGCLVLACIASVGTAWLAPDWLAAKGGRLLLLLDEQLHHGLSAHELSTRPERGSSAPAPILETRTLPLESSAPPPSSVVPEVDVSALASRLEILKKANSSLCSTEAVVPSSSPPLPKGGSEPASDGDLAEAKTLNAFKSMRSRTIAHLLGEGNGLDDRVAMELLDSLPAEKSEEVLESMSRLYPSRASQLVQLMVRKETEGKP